MIINLICSDKIDEKIHNLLDKYNIQCSDKGSLNLVEKGFEIPDHGLSIVFTNIDYVEAVELILKLQNEAEDQHEFVLGYYKDRYTMIKPNEVLYIEAQGNDVTCITQTGTYYLKRPLYYYESKFARSSFFRANKSQIVNLLKVSQVIPWFNSRLVLTIESSKTQIEVSKKYSKILRQKLKL